jgi:hypothetical protein
MQYSSARTVGVVIIIKANANSVAAEAVNFFEVGFMLSFFLFLQVSREKDS